MVEVELVAEPIRDRAPDGFAIRPFFKHGVGRQGRLTLRNRPKMEVMHGSNFRHSGDRSMDIGEPHSRRHPFQQDVDAVLGPRYAERP
ncbi:hypothetical protein ABIE78_004735 [Sinorhizobium fredii]